MEIEVGQVIELETGEAYLIGSHFMHDGQEYVSLVAVKEPVHMRFAEVNEEGDKSYINIVEDIELINLFKQYVVNDYFSAVEDEDDSEDEETEAEYQDEEYVDGEQEFVEE